MPARVRTEWGRPRKSGMVVFHRAFSQNWCFFTVHTRGCWNFERALQGQPRRSSPPRGRWNLAEPIGSKAQSFEMDEFQLGAKAELFPNYFATEEGKMMKFTTDLIAKRGFRARKRRERSGTVERL